MRALSFVALLSVVAVVLSLAGACNGTSTFAEPVECGSGTVTCEMDAICCPSTNPYYCGGPSDPDNVGCYETLAQAASVCQSVLGVDGGSTSDAYKCQ